MTYVLPTFAAINTCSVRCSQTARWADLLYAFSLSLKSLQLIRYTKGVKQKLRSMYSFITCKTLYPFLSLKTWTICHDIKHICIVPMPFLQHCYTVTFRITHYFVSEFRNLICFSRESLYTFKPFDWSGCALSYHLSQRCFLYILCVRH